MDEHSQAEMTDEEYEQEVARRVRLVGVIVLAVAIGVIALSALTLKADQVNDLPRSSIGGMPDVPEKAVEPAEP